MRKVVILFFIFLSLGVSGYTQTGLDEEACVNRKPVVSGQFYPDNKEALQTTLIDLFSKAEKRAFHEPVAAVIAPHAGYVYSGVVAASSYNQIDPETEYDNIFILGTSHRESFEGASIYSEGHYETPLGTVKVNRDLAHQLIEEYDKFHFRESAHNNEHSLEVQLPFLQYHLEKPFQIVPVVTGTHDPKVCEKIGNALKPYFNERNLFIISTDFSHYPNYNDAKKIDEATANAVTSNSVQRLIQTIRANTNKDVKNLLTSMCGWPSVLSLLSVTEGQDDIVARKILYENSGDRMSDKSRVVGYWSIVFYRKQTENRDMSFEINSKEKEVLLDIARNTLENFIRHGIIPEVDESKITKTLETPAGAFVTLHKKGELRGCIGRFKPEKPLYKVVQDMAIASSTQDVRFPEVSEDELDEIDIEISVLTPMERVSSVDEIELGKHGVYIKKGNRAGTFLPQVAEMTNWSKEEFLGHCARDKAGLRWNEWKDGETELYTYRAIIINEKPGKN